MGEYCGDLLNALGDERIARVAPRGACACVPAGRHCGRNPLVESRGYQCLFRVAGVAGDCDRATVHFLQSV